MNVYFIVTSRCHTEGNEAMVKTSSFIYLMQKDWQKSGGKTTRVIFYFFLSPIKRGITNLPTSLPNLTVWSRLRQGLQSTMVEG